MPDRIYRRQDSTVWWCVYYGNDGRRRRVSTKCTDKRAAALVLKGLERRVAAGQDHDPETAEPIPMSQIISEFLADGMIDIADGTQHMYRVKSGHVQRLLGQLDARALTFDDVLGYVNQRRKETARRETIKKELVALRQILKLAAQRHTGVADFRIVIPKVKTDYVPKDRWLTEDEYLKLLAALPEQRRDFVRVAVYTGARKSELERFAWSHVDLKQGWISVPGKKTARARRHVPIEKPLRACLEAMAHRSGLLLEPWPDMNHQLPEASVKAGIPRITCNDLRRTFASWMLQQGANPFEVARLLGHASTKMVEQVYGHLAAKNLIRAVRRMPYPEKGRVTSVTEGSRKLAIPAVS